MINFINQNGNYWNSLLLSMTQSNKNINWKQMLLFVSKYLYFASNNHFDMREKNHFLTGFTKY